jgi:AcrR family transcriptional regulator
MKTGTKLPAAERRAAIIRAVRRVFAEKGFHGTTTRELADAAGVSEALLFKHFPNKEALFSAMQLACSKEDPAVERLKSLEPSASTLVLLVHFLVSRVVGYDTSHSDEQAIQKRLLLRSLAEDGEFARLLLRHLSTKWVPKVVECCQAAVAAGEAIEGGVRPELGAWFTHHLAGLILFHHLPEKPVVDYGVPRDQLVAQAVWFTLRGLGLKEPVIRRHYNPKALALLGS